MIEFYITRTNILIADGQVIDTFSHEYDAADMAVRFAQDNDARYSIHYERRAA